MNHVLDSNDFETETKINALIAVGDLCLAISEGFLQFLSPTMSTLMSAAEMTLKSTNFDSNELTSRLRDAIIDAFISILHGMQPVCQAGSDSDRGLQNYCSQILDYITELLKRPNLAINDDFIKNIYELYSDISEFYGERQLRSKFR